MKTSLTVLIFAFMCLHVTAQSCLKMEGRWINDLGSVLVIDQVGENGSIIGKYASSTGVDGKIFPLLGWVNTSEEHPDEVNISFTVRWEGYGSITSWTGYCLDQPEGGSSIKTMWNLVRSGKEFPWERILTNSSTFVAEN